MAKIAVMGSGGWGTAIAVMLSNHGNEVVLWSKFVEEIETLQKDREHKKLLKGVLFPSSLRLSSDISCAGEAEIIVMAVPSFAMRQTAAALKNVVREDQIVVSIAKGLEDGTLKRLSQVITEELGDINLAVMCGPSHAEEVGRGIPTANVVSAHKRWVAEAVQDAFMNPVFRLYTTHDMVGMELGASLKNVIAISAGICDGLGLGDNTKAALMTRGITEIARLGVAMGARSETFAGLSGIGDLIVTCTSMHSRNRRAGILIGQGVPVQEALSQIGMVVEGYVTAKAAYQMAQKAGVEMPIVQEAYSVLYEGKNNKDSIYDLMTRSKKHEIEEIWVKNSDW
jgi:glycerol-3-phosphate dehydrogenase (NAD(P)+)